MAKVSMMLINLVIISTMVLAKPANEALDKATDKDVDINSVHPENSTVIEKQTKNLSANQNSTNDDDFHTSVSFGTPTTHVLKPGTAFARIIDDIFQIPIGVLQNVARLLRGPFISNKTPEKVSSY